MGFDHVQLHSAEQLIVFGLSVSSALGNCSRSLLDLNESTHSAGLLKSCNVHKLFYGLAFAFNRKELRPIANIFEWVR